MTSSDQVTGGDALVRVNTRARLLLNGRDVTGVLGPDRTGLVTGLRPGPNELRAGSARLTLRTTPPPGRCSPGRFDGGVAIGHDQGR